MVNSDQCDDTNFVVNVQLQHASLVEQCLRVLDKLMLDICKIGGCSLYNQEADDLASWITTKIPAHMQYTCRHWASHLVKDDINDKMLALLLRFCSTQLLNWLEVMSLLGELGSAITSLQSAHAAVKVRYPNFCARSIDIQPFPKTLSHMFLMHHKNLKIMKNHEKENNLWGMVAPESMD